MENDYERALSRLSEIIGDLEGLDVVDPDLEEQVSQATDILKVVTWRLEERA